MAAAKAMKNFVIFFQRPVASFFRRFIDSCNSL